MAVETQTPYEALQEYEFAPRTTFVMSRGHDESGLSGTGDVLEGIIFADGAVGIHWLTELWSVTWFPSWRMFVQIHIEGHPTNRTVLRFSTGQTWEQDVVPPRVMP